MSDNTFDIEGGNNQIAPNATEASQHNHGAVQNITNNYAGDRPSRIAANFARLREEIGKDVDPRTRERVEYYETKLPGDKDVAEKLTDGGFTLGRIREAERLKELWAKEALRFADSPAAQDNNLLIYTRIVREFDIYITPMIEEGMPLKEVRRELHERIVLPIMDILERNGADDEDIRYTQDHIYGIIYYLTGNCHLNWMDYDNDNL